MKRSIRLAFATLPVLSSALMAGPRVPRGIYATVGIAHYEETYLKTHSSVPSDYFTGVYNDLLANPDLSGITLYVYWSRLNPNQPTSGPVERQFMPYDWTVVQDLFDAVETYNTAHKTQKTVQLVVTPGINSPTWLLGSVRMNDGLLSSCNYLFDGTYRLPPETECGKVTFWGFAEGGYDKQSGKASPQDLPMPWNSTYKNAWRTFLTALAKQFGSRTELVSIAVAGPTASSEEMILPTYHNTYGNNGVLQPNGLTPEQMWNELLAHHYTSAYKKYMKYQKSDVAFIDEWTHAIDVFGETFSGLTLTVSTGDGLPNLDAPLPTDVACNAKKEVCSFSIPPAPIDFASVCHPGNMDCAAEATILTYFIQSTVGGSNAKATQMDGMTGGAINGNLGVPGVKLISFLTDLYTSPSQRILGGSQFLKSFSLDATAAASEGGCPKPTEPTDWTCSREQSLYNVLVQFFDETSEGPSFPQGTVPFMPTSGSQPLNYLQVYGIDITYASAHVSDPAVPVTGTTKDNTVQDLLHMANLALMKIAEN